MEKEMNAGVNNNNNKEDKEIDMKNSNSLYKINIHINTESKINKDVPLQYQHLKKLTKEEKEEAKLKRKEIRKEKLKERMKRGKESQKKNKAQFYKEISEAGIFSNKREMDLYNYKLQEKSLQSKLKIIIDMDYVDHMTNKEITSLCYQIARSYGYNRIKKDLFSFYLFGCKDQRIDLMLKKMEACNWKVWFFKQNLSDYFSKSNGDISNKEVIGSEVNEEKKDNDLDTDNNIQLINREVITNSQISYDNNSEYNNAEKKKKELIPVYQDYNISIKEELEELKEKNSIIYLSPDSEEVIQDDEITKEEFCLIIGGFVDKTVKKNMSLNRARELNIKPRRLALEVIKNKNSNCNANETNMIIKKEKKLNVNQPLNIDNIVHIIHDYLEENYNWEKAFLNNFTKRIEIKLLNTNSQYSKLHKEHLPKENNTIINKDG